MTSYEVIFLIGGAIVFVIISKEYFKSKRQSEKMSIDFKTHLMSITICYLILIIYLVFKYVLGLIPQVVDIICFHIYNDTH